MGRPGTLRWRLGLLYASVAAVMLAIILAVVGVVVERSLLETTANRLEIEAGLIAADAGGGRKGPRAIDLAAGDLAAALGGQQTAVTILDPAGSTLAAQANGAAAWIAGARLSGAEYAAVVAGVEPVRAVVAPGVSGVSGVSGGSGGSGVSGASGGSGAEAGEVGRVLVVAAPIHIRENGGKGPPPGRGPGNQNPGRGLGLGGGAQDGSVATAAASPNAIAQLAVSLSPIDATLAGLRLTLALVGLGVLLAAIVTAWLVTTIGLRPLGRVAGAADRIAAGDLSARSGLPGGDDEIGRLGRAFDGMAERVDATHRAQRQFAADASHELRSPLTVLGGYVDVLARGALTDPAAAERTLAAMRVEIDRLSRLAGDLLLLAQLEAGGGRLEPRVLDLGTLLEDLGAAARAMGPDRRVVIERDGPLPVRADPDRLTQALMNLVDNAVRHTPPGGRVALAARRDGASAVAEVTNDGEPIPPEHLPRVFERFYQAHRDGGRDGSGHAGLGHAGLGLAISRAIVEASGGTVGVASDALGTRFSVRLPLG